jgi:protein-tyrosine phosphatase
VLKNDINCRLESISTGLTYFRKNNCDRIQNVVIHDSARCFVTKDHFEKLINEHIVSSTEFVKSKELVSLEDGKIKMVELPVNFSKVDDRIFGSGVIKERHLSVLKSLGISHVINLVGEEKPPAKYVESAKNMGIIIHHFPIDDFQNTSMEMINNILDLMNYNTEDSKPSIEGNKIVVNCMGGVGRTNMVLACYLIKSTNKSPSEVVTILSYNRKINLSIIICRLKIIYPLY